MSQRVIVKSQYRLKINGESIPKNTIRLYVAEQTLKNIFVELSLPATVVKDFLKTRKHFKTNPTSKMAHRAYRKDYERAFPHLQVAANSFSQRLDRQCRLNGLASIQQHSRETK